MASFRGRLTLDCSLMNLEKMGWGRGSTGDGEKTQDQSSDPEHTWKYKAWHGGLPITLSTREAQSREPGGKLSS